MDKYLDYTKNSSDSSSKRSPIYALLNTETGEKLIYNTAELKRQAEIAKREAELAEKEEEEKKRKKPTEVTKESQKKRKIQEKEEKITKTQQRNGAKLSADGTIAKVERPWKKYTKRSDLTKLCNNSAECDAKAVHAHEKDRTLIGQLDHNAERIAQASVKISPIAEVERTRNHENPPEILSVQPFHDHHPFLCATTQSLPVEKQSSDIVSADNEAEALKPLADSELKYAASDLFHLMLRLTRENVNAYHACVSQRIHIKRCHEKSVAELMEKENDAETTASPKRIVSEMKEIRDKRLMQCESDRVEIVNVIQESFEQKVSDVVQRCVAGSLLRPSAQEVVSRELYVHYKNFSKDHSESGLLANLASLLKREKC